MRIDYEEHYDRDYWTTQKRYRTPDGAEKIYQNPSLDWPEGWMQIAPAISRLIPKGTLLDIGCGGGGLAKQMLNLGHDAYGIDISQYAIDNCVEEMMDRVALCDITSARPEDPIWGQHTNGEKLLFPREFDALLATDLMEHIYEEDLEKTFSWMKEKSNFMFLLVATVGEDKAEFVHKKGEPVPLEWEATAVAGHVNVRPWSYWVKFFTSQGCTIRYDLMWRFAAFHNSLPWFREMVQWGPDCVYILQVRE